jgi:hypothetical protein
MHISYFPSFQSQLMTIRRISHCLKHTKYAHASHTLINYVPPIDVLRFLRTGTPDITAIRVRAFTGVRATFHAITWYAPGNHRFGVIL